MRISYDAISPITGNKCVLEDNEPYFNDIFRLCFESGYFSLLRNMTADSEYLTDFEKTQPPSIVGLKKMDSDGSAWFPLIMFHEEFVLYPKIESGEISDWVISTWQSAESADDRFDDIIVATALTQPDETVTLQYSKPCETSKHNGSFPDMYDKFISLTNLYE